jgi:hypothetical protein
MEVTMGNIGEDPIEIEIPEPIEEPIPEPAPSEPSKEPAPA